MKNNKQNLHFAKDTIGSRFLRELSMIICIVLSLILIILDLSSSTGLQKAKMGLQSSFSNIFSATKSIENSVDDFFKNFNTVSELNKQNEKLYKENAEMQMWKNKSLRFEAENKSLRELLKFDNLEEYEYKSAEISIDNSKSFNREVVINAENLYKDQTIISAYGLVGRVINTDESHGSVLLITDIQSRVPAIVERTREKVIISGKNTNKLSLDYLSEERDITLGDRLITSGDGGVFEPGFLIGEVSHIEENKINVTPATNFSKLEFVSVVIKKKEKIIDNTQNSEEVK